MVWADVDLNAWIDSEGTKGYFAKPAAADDFGSFSQVGDATVARGDTNHQPRGRACSVDYQRARCGTILLGGIHRFSNGQTERGWFADEAESKPKEGRPYP